MKTERAPAYAEAYRVWEQCGRVIVAAARALGVSERTVRRRLARYRSTCGTGSDATAAAIAPVSARPGRSLAEWEAKYDRADMVPRRIEAALAQLGECWEYEIEFMRRAQISSSDLARYRDRYLDHVVYVRAERRRVWVGSAEAAKKMREMLI